MLLLCKSVFIIERRLGWGGDKKYIQFLEHPLHQIFALKHGCADTPLCVSYKELENIGKGGQRRIRLIQKLGWYDTLEGIMENQLEQNM